MRNIFDLSNDIMNNIIKYYILHVSVYFIFIKIINFKETTKKHFVFLGAMSLFLAVDYEILKIHMGQISSLVFSLVLICLIIKYITQKNIFYILTVSLLSFSIYFALFAVSAIIITTIGAIILDTPEPNFYYFLVMDAITILLVYLFLKIKKIKNGLYFLHNNESIEAFGITGFALCCSFMFVVTILFSRIGVVRTFFLEFALWITIIIIGIFIFIWIRSTLIKYYKNRQKDKTIAELEKELAKSKKANEELAEENLQTAKATHSVHHRIQTLQRFAINLLNSPIIPKKVKKDLEKELEAFIKELDYISYDYHIKVRSKKKYINLPLTHIYSIDRVIEYMQAEATNYNIDFDFKINGSIHYLIENYISEDDLSTLLSDHIKDAIIAINFSKNTYKSILIVLGVINNCYGLCIYDSGIPFTINTLINIGLNPVTTHSKTGGTGLGFMSTFDILKETGASLVINEKKESKTDFTKSISILFDKKQEYRISSYRITKLKQKDLNNRIKFINK